MVKLTFFDPLSYRKLWHLYEIDYWCIELRRFFEWWALVLVSYCNPLFLLTLLLNLVAILSCYRWYLLDIKPMVYYVAFSLPLTRKKLSALYGSIDVRNDLQFLLTNSTSLCVLRWLEANAGLILIGGKQKTLPLKDDLYERKYNWCT